MTKAVCVSVISYILPIDWHWCSEELIMAVEDLKWQNKKQIKQEIKWNTTHIVLCISFLCVRRRGRNIIGHWAIGNVTMCAAISHNTMHLLAFLDGLQDHVHWLDQREPAQPQQSCYVRDWFTNNPRFSNIFLPAYSPFLNPIEFFSAWRWKVYDRDPYMRVNLLQAMEEACFDITVESCQGWIRHTRGFPPLPT